MKTIEILQHNIEWWLDDDSIVELDESDIEHINQMIREGYNCGELNHANDEIHGSWSIKK